MRPLRLQIVAMSSDFNLCLALEDFVPLARVQDVSSSFLSGKRKMGFMQSRDPEGSTTIRSSSPSSLFFSHHQTPLTSPRPHPHSWPWRHFEKPKTRSPARSRSPVPVDLWATNETTTDRGFWGGPTNETTPDRGFWGGPTNETTPQWGFLGGPKMSCCLLLIDKARAKDKTYI